MRAIYIHALFPTPEKDVPCILNTRNITKIIEGVDHKGRTVCYVHFVHGREPTPIVATMEDVLEELRLMEDA